MFASSEYLLGQLWAATRPSSHAGFSSTRATRRAVRTGAQRRDRGRAPGPEVAQQPADVRLDGVQLLRLLPRAPLGAAQPRRLRARRGGAHQGDDGRRPDALRRHPFPAPGRDGRSGWTQPVQVQELRLRQRAQRRRRDHRWGSRVSSPKATPRSPPASRPRPTSSRESCSRSALHPPAYAFTDRSRVSITFDESGKYGITWSQHSTVSDSLMAGYAASGRDTRRSSPGQQGDRAHPRRLRRAVRTTRSSSGACRRSSTSRSSVTPNAW